MIIIYHKHNKVTGVWYADQEVWLEFEEVVISRQMLRLAQKYPEHLLIWCDEDLKPNLNTSALPHIFHSKHIMASYSTSRLPYLGKLIGYVDNSLFINVKYDVVYPTWLMHSDVGGMHAEVLLNLRHDIEFERDFNYFLNALAKRCMPQGLFCYSNPELLKALKVIYTPKVKNRDVFKFVKQHYKGIWVFLLFFNILIYEGQFLFLELFRTLFIKRVSTLTDFKVSHDIPESLKPFNTTIDVILPTIGRKNYVFDVLKDLSKQTLLPKKVIVVEQNPDANSVSELDYITTERWPFVIKHIFTHKTGACFARNRALSEVESDWVFLADDDNRIEAHVLKAVLTQAATYRVKAVTTAYPQKEEIIKQTHVSQSGIFGAGNSFVKTKCLKDVAFNPGFEFGYGEDNDFGMQLRNKGVDIMYLPEPSILHLKAPRGGFRMKPKQLWDEDAIQPKPSPTVMLFQLLHQTKAQQLSYKTTLFLKYYKNQSITNPLKYYKTFKKQWRQSLKYANQLKNNNL